MKFRKASLKRLPIMASLALTGLLILHTAPILAGTLRVPEDYSTIAEAMASASSGDEVVVGPGEYTESVTMVPDVSLRGAGPESTSIDGGAESAIISANNCRINGIFIRIISICTVAMR